MSPNCGCVRCFVSLSVRISFSGAIDEDGRVPLFAVVWCVVGFGVFVVRLLLALLFSMWVINAAFSFRCVIFKFQPFCFKFSRNGCDDGYEEGNEEGYAEGHEGEGRLQLQR